MLLSSNFPSQQAPTKRRHMARRSRAPRRTWSDSRPALQTRSRPGESQFARLAHWECRAETSCQAPGGETHSCALVHRQSRSPGEPPPSPSQSASSWTRPFYLGIPWRAAPRRRLVVRGRIAAVGCVIGIAVAAPVVVVIEAVTKARHETPAAEVPLMAEVTAGRGEVLTRNAATESRAGPADMAKAADMSAAAKAADMSAAEPAAHMSAAAETSAVSTAEAPTVSTPTTSAAARKRISGQSGAKRGSRRQDDHGLA